MTFCCYHRRPLFIPGENRQVFEFALERVRKSFSLRVYGYVVMPEHVHLLLSEPRLQTLAVALKSLKQGVARRLIGNASHFWQKLTITSTSATTLSLWKSSATFTATR